MAIFIPQTVLGQDVIPPTTDGATIIVKVVTGFQRPTLKIIPKPGATGIQGIQGPQGIPGPEGPSGIAHVSSPLSINESTNTISLDQTAFNTIYDDRYMAKVASIDSGEI